MAPWATNKLTPQATWLPGGSEQQGLCRGWSCPLYTEQQVAGKRGWQEVPEAGRWLVGWWGTPFSSAHPVDPHSCCREHLPGFCSLQRVSAVPCHTVAAVSDDPPLQEGDRGCWIDLISSGDNGPHGSKDSASMSDAKPTHPSYCSQCVRSLIPQDEEDMWLSGCNYSRACDMEAWLLLCLHCSVGFCAAWAPSCLAPPGSPAKGCSGYGAGSLQPGCSSVQWGEQCWLPVGFVPVMESTEATGAWGWKGEGAGRAVLARGEGGCWPGQPGNEHPFPNPRLLLVTMLE